MTRLADIPSLADVDIVLADGDIITDAVIVSALSNVDIDLRLSIQTMDGTSWITAIGLLVAASDIQRADIGAESGDGE